jgi:cell division protein ZipA
MEESFRNSLIIISAIIIGAIFVHGLWTIRKNKNPYKLKATPKEIEAQELKKRDFDRSGFDQDGVSQVKVVSKTESINTVLENEHEFTNKVNSENELTQNNNSTDAQGIDDNFKAQSHELNDEIDFNLDISVVEQDDLAVLTDIKEAKSVYENPVNKPKPVRETKKTASKIARKKTKNTLKREQMEINFGSSDSGLPNKASKSIDPEVLAISVIMPQGQIISGAALLPSLLTLGMKYGEMNIFHRHQDNAGNGKVTFSLANAMNPGTFDLDNMENFVTQGVSLFMTLPNANDPFAVFEQMLVAAKQLALEFNGQLLDDKRSVMTKQTEQHYITKIREFERKSRLASL